MQEKEEEEKNKKEWVHGCTFIDCLVKFGWVGRLSINVCKYSLSASHLLCGVLANDFKFPQAKALAMLKIWWK